MKGISTLKAGAATFALLAVAGMSMPACAADEAASHASTVSQADYDALAKRVDALEEELQAAEVRASQDHDKVDAWQMPTGWWNDTKISGRMYYDMTSLDQKTDGAKSSNNGFSFDIKRFYVGIDHTFNDVFSADITTDFKYDSTAGATQLYIKKAYVDIKLDKAFEIRLGSTDMPWIPYAEGAYGMRYVENTVTDRTKFGTSADWGVHFMGALPYGFDYQISITTGAGYKNTSRTKQPDFEGRVGYKNDGFTFAIGGKLGLNGVQHGTKTYNTAGRFDVLAAYKFSETMLKGLNVGVEYFYAPDYTQVKSETHSHGYGVSPFADYQIAPKWKIFGRYDYVSPYSDASRKDFENNYYNIGISYSPTQIVDFALVYKRDEGDNGYISDSNGTIGGSAFASGNSGSYSEVGLWGRVRW